MTYIYTMLDQRRRLWADVVNVMQMFCVYWDIAQIRSHSLNTWPHATHPIHGWPQVTHFNPYNAELFCINHGDQRGFLFQFQIIINVLELSLSDSFEYLCY